MRSKTLFLLLLLLLCVGTVTAQGATPETTPEPTSEGMGAMLQATQSPEAIPDATIVNDEGGPVTVSGTLTYTNLFFTEGVSEPEVILEDEAGFVDRNHHFIIPVRSQVIGQLTSDFYTSPVDYTLSLPQVPNGDYRDVNHDGNEDQGVQVFGIAYWTNTWGDPYLEARDLYGGGWSTAYASFETSPDPSKEGEVIGGKYIVYTADDQQDFPSGFGADGKLFTDDDPLVRLPAGYTVVDMDTTPFTFDRSSTPTIDMIEGQASQLNDYSQMSYADAFSALLEQMRNEYAFTEYKNIDWDALKAEFLPRFQKADKDQDAAEYAQAVLDFQYSIPDGHVGSSAINLVVDKFQTETAGGMGMALTKLDDGSVIVSYLLSGGPADQAGIQLGAAVTKYDGEPVLDAASKVVPWSAPFSTDLQLQLQQLRYLLRSQVGTDVSVTYRNPGDTQDQTVTLTSVAERQSFAASSFSLGGPTDGFELPLSYQLLPNGYAYVAVYSFFDDARLTIQLWERLINTINQQQIPGLIIDMRHNGGGSGFLADEMAAYFFNDEVDLGNSEVYDKSRGEFYLDPAAEQHYILPDQQFRYQGQIAVLVGPACYSACEFFTRDMTLENRAAIVGEYPTGGLGGSVEQVLLPEGVSFQFPIARNLDAQGNIVIEGKGIPPTVQVPITADTVFAQGDPVLDAAVNWLDQQQ